MTRKEKTAAPPRWVPLIGIPDPRVATAMWAAVADAESEEGWWIQAVFTEQEGLPILKELHIRPSRGKPTPAGGITSRWLRSLRLTPAFEAIRAAAASEIVSPGIQVYPDWLGDQAEEVSRELFHEQTLHLADSDLHRRPGRPPLSASVYAQVAVEYERIVNSGSNSPIPQLAKKLGYSPSRTRDLVWQARQRGYLTPTRPGRAGGRATEKARTAYSA